MKIKHSSDHNTAFLGVHRDMFNSGYYAKRKRSCACPCSVYDKGRQKMFARSLDKAMHRITDGISQWKSLTASCLAFLKSFIAAIFNILQKAVTFGSASSFKGDCRNVSAAATIAARPPPKMNILSYVTIAIFALFIGLTSCSKSDSTAPIEEPYETTSPTQLTAHKMFSALGLIPTTKSYNPVYGDIKTLSFSDEEHNTFKKYTLDEENSDGNEMVYNISTYVNGHQNVAQKNILTPIDENSFHVANYVWSPTFQQWHPPDNYIYTLKNDEVIVDWQNDDGEYVFDFKYIKDTPSSVIVESDTGRQTIYSDVQIGIEP